MYSYNALSYRDGVKDKCRILAMSLLGFRKYNHSPAHALQHQAECLSCLSIVSRVPRCLSHKHVHVHPWSMTHAHSCVRHRQRCGYESRYIPCLARTPAFRAAAIINYTSKELGSIRSRTAFDRTAFPPRRQLPRRRNGNPTARTRRYPSPRRASTADSPRRSPRRHLRV